MNNIYVKITEDGYIQDVAREKVLKYNNKTVINPKKDNYIAAGYYPILNINETPEQKEGYKAITKYKLSDTEIGIVKYFEYIKLKTNET